MRRFLLMQRLMLIVVALLLPTQGSSAAIAWHPQADAIAVDGQSIPPSVEFMQREGAAVSDKPAGSPSSASPSSPSSLTVSPQGAGGVVRPSGAVKAAATSTYRCGDATFQFPVANGYIGWIYKEKATPLGRSLDYDYRYPDPSAQRIDHAGIDIFPPTEDLEADVYPLAAGVLREVSQTHTQVYYPDSGVTSYMTHIVFNAKNPATGLAYKNGDRVDPSVPFAKILKDVGNTHLHFSMKFTGFHPDPLDASHDYNDAPIPGATFPDDPSDYFNAKLNINSYTNSVPPNPYRGTPYPYYPTYLQVQNTYSSWCRASIDNSTAITGPFSYTLNPGGQVTYRIGFGNNGTTNWRAASGYYMRNTVLGTVFNMGTPLAAGGCEGLPPNWSCSWNVTFTAGSTPGVYTYPYRMSKGGSDFGGTITVTVTIVGNTGNRTPGDFNGDGKTDLAVFRPSNGTWWIHPAYAGQWGQSGDIPVAGDYNGDGRTDIAVYRPSNRTWWIRPVYSGQWGEPGDIPVPGDYNGDGRTDIAVYRPSNGVWFPNLQPYSQYFKGWGAPGDIPVPGDYDGDGKTDLAVFRPSNGTWWIYPTYAGQWGQAGDIPVPGDYNGDGKTDIAVYRPSNRTWWIRPGYAGQWGEPGDIPVPGDYNGDRRTDIAVYRPSNGVWFPNIQPYSQYFKGWGAPGDIPAIKRPTHPGYPF